MWYQKILSLGGLHCGDHGYCIGQERKSGRFSVLTLTLFYLVVFTEVLRQSFSSCIVHLVFSTQHILYLRNFSETTAGKRVERVCLCIIMYFLDVLKKQNHYLQCSEVNQLNRSGSFWAQVVNFQPSQNLSFPLFTAIGKPCRLFGTSRAPDI